MGTSPDVPPAPVVGLAATLASEPAGRCGVPHDHLPDQVCRRPKGHDGPHVTTVDEVPVQWEA